MKQIFHCSKQDSCDLVFLFNSSFICAWSFALIDYHTVDLYRYVCNYKYLLTFLILHTVENFDFFQFYFSIEHRILQNKIFCICSNSLRPTFQFPFNSSRYFKFQTLISFVVFSDLPENIPRNNFLYFSYKALAQRKHIRSFYFRQNTCTLYFLIFLI